MIAVDCGKNAKILVCLRAMTAKSNIDGLGYSTLNAVDCGVDVPTEACAALLTAIDCGSDDLETQQMSA